MNFVIIDSNELTKKMQCSRYSPRVLDNGQSVLRVTRMNEEALKEFKKYTKGELNTLDLESLEKHTSKILDYDKTGRQVVSTAIVPRGWSYHAPTFRILSATSNAIDFKDKFGNDMSSMISLKCFESASDYYSFVECAPEDALFTVATFTPPYDYYIVSGTMRQEQRPTESVKLYATLAPFIPYEQGGSREFICCSDLLFKDELVADGRAPKFVPHIQVSEVPALFSNSIEIFLNHSKGFQHEIEVEIGIYKK